MYDELVKELRHLDEYSKQINPTPSGIFREAADAIEKLSKERKHGKWVEDEDGCVCCSLCGNPCEINGITGEFLYSPYCSECGADMIGGDENV